MIYLNDWRVYSDNFIDDNYYYKIETLDNDPVMVGRIEFENNIYIACFWEDKATNTGSIKEFSSLGVAKAWVLFNLRDHGFVLNETILNLK